MRIKKEYVRFVQGFNAFFEREKVEYMSSAPTGDEESYFSRSPCGCCGSSLSGNRENYVAYNFKEGDDTKIEVSVCQDCIYFNEYGKLDDTSMLDIDKDECPAVVNGKKGTLVGPANGQRMVFKDENNELSPVSINTASIEFV